jgi:glycosyltransferase involved in cell wall biosynthesis
MMGENYDERITLYIIAYNEEETIGRCISSFKGACDDIVVVLDDRTTDKTEQIAWDLGARIYHFHWIDDFSAARNYALDRCLFPWRMFADADDVLDPASVDLVRQAVRYANENGIDSIISHYYTSEVNGIPLTDNAMARLTRTGTMRWEGKIHECQNFDRTKTMITNIEVWHRKPRNRTSNQRNIGILEKEIPNCNPEDLPRYTFYYARELMFGGRYREAIEWFDKYLPISTWDAEKHRAMCDKAECFYSLGEKEDADRVLAEAIAYRPQWPDPYVKRGIIAHEQGRHEDGLVQFTLAQDRLENVHPLFSNGGILPKMIKIYTDRGHES